MPRNWKSMEDFDAFLNAGGVVECDDTMPDEYRRAVFQFVERHANSELMAALSVRNLVPGTPGLRQKMAALGKAQDEIGHANALYQVAADLGSRTRSQMIEELLAGRSRVHHIFHRQPEVWADQVVVALMVDSAALVCQQAVHKNCSYGPYRRALKRMVAEEEQHAEDGESTFLRVATGTPSQRDLLQQAVDRWWWPSLRFFGPDAGPDEPLVRWHIKSGRNQQLRDRWVQRMVPLLRSNGFSVPDRDLRFDDDRQRWIPGVIQWDRSGAEAEERSRATAKRIDDASGNWQRTAWVRRAMDRPQLVGVTAEKAEVA